MQFAALHESLHGTKLPNPDVRYPVAIGAKSDIAQKAQIASD
jgi:hypothetical protein